MQKLALHLNLAVLAVALTASDAVAQGNAAEAPIVQVEHEGHTFSKIDHDALSQMTREERRAYMQAFKQRRADEAAVAGMTPSAAGGYRPLDQPRSSAGSGVRALGTIQYDSGTVTGTAGVASQMVGNRFDSALNTAGTMCCFPIPTSGSVTMITFDMVNTFFGSAVWSLYSNISGTMADQVTSMARAGIMTGLNTLSVASPTTANAYMNGAFLAGIWQFDPTMTALGVDTMSNSGQGFHGISNNDGAMATMLTAITSNGMGLNAVFRIGGNVLTPVELLSFDIED